MIGALICLDAREESHRRRGLIEKLRVSSGGGPDKIICLPAMASTNWVDDLPNVWRDHCMIFANSDSAIGSFISINGTVVVRSKPDRYSIELIPA